MIINQSSSYICKCGKQLPLLEEEGEEEEEKTINKIKKIQIYL